MDVSYIIAIWFLFLQCRLSLGECHCRVKSQCDLHQTTCKSGCEAGFTGSRCQYENILRGHTLDPYNRKLVDGNIMTCSSYHRRIYARDIKSAGRVNTLRIRYEAGTLCGCKEWKLCKTQCPGGCRRGYMGPLCKYKKPVFAKVKLKKGNKQLTATEDASEPGLLLYTFEPNNVTDITLPLSGKVCEVELSYEDHSDPVETATSMAAFQSITTPAKTRGKTGCSVDHYGDGQDCTRCGAGCRGGCDGIDGHCTCKTGWTGTRCNNCEDGYYMDRGDCVACGAGCESGTCEANTGLCSCMSGWKGPRCTTLCPPGTYGEHCRLNCSAGCVNQTCDRIDGTCDVCLPGWNMAKCDNRCDPGTYGPDCMYECNEGCQPEQCDPADGNCGSYCRSGWTGANCDTVCIPGTYGENCQLMCSVGCVNQTCDRETGECDICQSGWIHQNLNTSMCDEEVLMQTSGSCLPPFVLWFSITTIVTVGAAVLRPAILV